ncbi:MAG: ECF transporter S component [Clostridia bacterium]|nr:ECF transporter S component [Clostridia bacterium]
MSNKKMSKLVKFTQLAVLAAIVVVMSFTPLGYLKIGPLSIALVIIPVVTGAIVLGPGAGAFMGLVFGVTSFAQCFGMDAFGTTLMSINPFFTFIMCIPTRVLAGFLCGLIFKGMSGALSGKKSAELSYPVAAVSGPVFNTLFFMSSLILFFGKTDFIQNMMADTGAENLLMFFVIMIGVNGIVEILSCLVVASALSKALSVANKKMRI